MAKSGQTSSHREAGSPNRPESREAWRATSEIKDDVWSPRWSAQQLQIREEELWTCSTKNHPKKNRQAKKNIQNYWKLTCSLKIMVGRWFMSFKKSSLFRKFSEIHLYNMYIYIYIYLYFQQKEPVEASNQFLVQKILITISSPINSEGLRVFHQLHKKRTAWNCRLVFIR